MVLDVVGVLENFGSLTGAFREHYMSAVHLPASVFEVEAIYTTLAAYFCVVGAEDCC
jgi:hypothetical protein